MSRGRVKFTIQWQSSTVRRSKLVMLDIDSRYSSQVSNISKFSNKSVAIGSQSSYGTSNSRNYTTCVLYSMRHGMEEMALLNSYLLVWRRQ